MTIDRLFHKYRSEPELRLEIQVGGNLVIIGSVACKDWVQYENKNYTRIRKHNGCSDVSPEQILFLLELFMGCKYNLYQYITVDGKHPYGKCLIESGIIEDWTI